MAEVGPNDIVIHLVNPYKCGDCSSEFCIRSLFLEHLAEHIDLLKSATPCHQIVCTTNLVEQQSGGITVTRDILQINEHQMFELQDVSLDYTQLTPLKALEQAGILNLPRPLPVPVSAPPTKENRIVMDMLDPGHGGRKISLLRNHQLQHENSGLHVQILNTSHSKVKPDSSVEIVQHLEAGDAYTPEMDSLVQQALFGDGKVKEERRVTLSSPVQLTDDHSLADVVSLESHTTDFECVENKSILGRGKNTYSPKKKDHKNNVVCLICPNVFENSNVLERHQVVHTGAKPYSCSVCFKVFNDVSSHRKHSLIHKRQQRCPVCHRMYLRRTQLLLHMKQHKKKRFIQFGNNFHEVQVNVTRNSEGQMVQEYSLPLLLKGDAGDKNIDVLKEDQILYEGGVKEECTEPSTGLKNIMSQAQDNIAAISDDIRVLESDNANRADDHLNSENKKKIIYRCGHCKLLIYTRPTLSRHLIKHTNMRPFQCEKCLKSFHDKADLLHHHKTHTKPVQCKTCFSSFSKVLYLQNHLLKGCPVTDNDSRFTLLPDLRCQCNVCQKILKNKVNVLRHLRVHAFQDRTKSPGHEGETTATPENMQCSGLENLSQNPEEHFHPLPNSVGYHCMICGHEFRFKSIIITHIRMHLNQRTYKCSDCPKSFYTRQMLKKHQQNHTRPYKCPACNRGFIRRYLMKQHFQKRHEHEDPLKDITELLEEKLIQCDICGKTMKSFQKSLMVSHIRLHKDVRPFECRVCHKSFISGNALKKHSLNHTKPYTCHICSKGFSRRYLLTDHFKKKCGLKKRVNSKPNSHHVSQEDNRECGTSELGAVLSPSTTDVSTECQPYEAKVITEHDPSTNSSTYTCQPCDKRFSLYDALVRHINTFSKATACKYCKTVFPDKHLTLMHQRSCLGPSSNLLQKCSMKSKALGGQQQKIQKIMKNINKKIETIHLETSLSEMSKDNVGTQSNCANSDEMLPQNSPGNSQVEHTSTPITRTLNILREEKDRLTCPECDRRFDTPRGLKIHVSSHVRLFKCEVCGKDFAKISNLRAHAKLHKNEVETGSQSEISSKLPKKNEKPEEGCIPVEENEDQDAKVTNVNQAQAKPSRGVIVAEKRKRKKVSESEKETGDGCGSDKGLLDITHRLMQSGTRGRPFSCRMCRRRFTEEVGLRTHMLHNHGVRAWIWA